MVAGAAAPVAVLRPFLQRIGRSVFVLGEAPGQGQVMKLVNNLLIAANMVAAFEALAMGAKAGLDPDTMVEVVNAGTGRSFVTSDMMPVVLRACESFHSLRYRNSSAVACGVESSW